MKILLFFHGGSGNKGCEAIVRTAVKVIKKEYPDIFIALASTMPETDRHIPGLDRIIFHNQNRSFKRFTPAYFKMQFETRFLKSSRSNYRLMHKDIIERIDNYDIFLSIGGDNYCYGEIPDYYELDRLIKSKGKRLLLWGASVGKEDLTSVEKRKDLKSFDKLLIRESASQTDLINEGFKNAELVADGAFVLDTEEIPLPAEWENGNTIGFNYSPMILKRHPQSRQAAIELLKHILKTTDFKIAMTPHVVIPGNDDHACMHELIEELKEEKGSERIFLLPADLNAVQTKSIISKMRMFVGARTHATIAAYSSLVPVLVLGYSIKSIGIAKDIFGTQRLVLDKSEISDSKLLIEKFEELKRDETKIREILKNKIPEIQSKAYSAVKYL
ncbi:MAG: polysaccharide pyruvyl transferase family protein [Moheibacter sp.]